MYRMKLYEDPYYGLVEMPIQNNIYLCTDGYNPVDETHGLDSSLLLAV
jgi:hypothetical protein